MGISRLHHVIYILIQIIPNALTIFWRKLTVFLTTNQQNELVNLMFFFRYMFVVCLFNSSASTTQSWWLSPSAERATLRKSSRESGFFRAEGKRSIRRTCRVSATHRSGSGTRARVVHVRTETVRPWSATRVVFLWRRQDCLLSTMSGMYSIGHELSCA